MQRADLVCTYKPNAAFYEAQGPAGIETLTATVAYITDEAVRYLVEILKTPIGEVTADHRLAQSYDAKSGKIELPNKLGALQLLAKMCG